MNPVTCAVTSSLRRWSTLPNEQVIQIAAFLDKKDWGAMCRTIKQWNNSLHQKCYRSFAIAEFFRNREQLNDLGSLKIEISKRFKMELSISHIIKMSCSLKNLDLSTLLIDDNEFVQISRTVHKLNFSISSLCLAGCSNLKNLDFSKFLKLQTLDLRSCTRLKNVRLDGLANLRVLNLRNCITLRYISFRRLKNLQVLWLDGCTELQNADFGDLIRLQQLSLSFCVKLQSPDFSSLSSKVKIWGWENIVNDETSFYRGLEPYS